LQKALRIPDPTLFVQYEHEPPDLQNTVGFGVSFPLPLWNRNRGGIASAKAAQEQARLQAQKVQAAIRGEVAFAQIAYADASGRWERHRTELQPKSAEVRQTVSFAYEKGGASLLDLLSAQRTDNEVRLATAQAAAETAKAAADLKAALNVGNDLPEK
jgi:cobalt-zinc-cadmium efflux system outer membrane protein